ncbi:MAG TPA: dihydrolipoamide acyltransferase [Ruminococcus sp.]|nr:dihydrolipoamide acyltransferase [Ruminococcus sp.]
MKTIMTSITGASETAVLKDKLASSMGSGSLDVYATPSMVALMEAAACECIANYLEDDETTVGTELNIKHISATPEGMMVRAEAELVKFSGREFTFAVKAYDESGLIGEGEHKRFLVYGKKFTEKAKAKIK